MLQIGNPDYYTEEFWLHFKQSMFNFYNVKKIKLRNIEKWSKRLDMLQSKKQYEEIEHCIVNYIYLFSIDMMKYGDLYHTNILIKNIERWNFIHPKLNLFELEDTKYKKICYLLKIFFNFLEKNLSTELFFDIDLMILMDDYYELLNVAFEKKMSLPFDHLSKFIDLKSYIKKYFDLDIKEGMMGKKIIKLKQ